MTYPNAQPDCPYCHGEELNSYDLTYEVICRCRNGTNGISFNPLVKRLTVKDNARFSSKDGETPWGWFHINQNWWGWTISELTDFDREWLEGEGLSTDNVFRTVSETGHWNIAHFNFRTGTFAFIDGDHYLNSDHVRWERHTPYTHVYVDSEYAAEVLQANKGA